MLPPRVARGLPHRPSFADAVTWLDMFGGDATVLGAVAGAEGVEARAGSSRPAPRRTQARTRAGQHTAVAMPLTDLAGARGRRRRYSVVAGAGGDAGRGRLRKAERLRLIRAGTRTAS